MDNNRNDIHRDDAFVDMIMRKETVSTDYPMDLPKPRRSRWLRRQVESVDQTNTDTFVEAREDGKHRRLMRVSPTNSFIDLYIVRERYVSIQTHVKVELIGKKKKMIFIDAIA